MTVDYREYWERRYVKGTGSGAGSRDEAVELKAEYINRVLSFGDIRSVVDWGCGDGQLVRLLNMYQVHYVGIEISPTALVLCMTQQPDPVYILWDEQSPHTHVFADMSMSIDVLFHFVDNDDYFPYLKRLFASAGRYVLVHTTDRDEPSNKHVRHRLVAADIAQMFPDWKLVDEIPGVNTCKFLLYVPKERDERLPETVAREAQASLGEAQPD